MEKILEIDGRQVKFKSTGAFLVRYKTQFKRDALRDIMLLETAVDKKTKKIINLDAVDLEVFYNLIWTLAKTADPNTPPPLEWLDSFDVFPIVDILPELAEMMFSSFQATNDFKKK